MSDIPNCFYRVSIKALILDEEKRFLMIQESNGKWELPGGGLDFGEKPHDCLKREIREEMSLEIDTINTRPSYVVTTLHTDNHWKCFIAYETKIKNLNFTPSDECVAIKFFNKEEALKEKLFPIVKEFVKQYDHKNHSAKKFS